MLAKVFPHLVSLEAILDVGGARTVILDDFDNGHCPRVKVDSRPSLLRPILRYRSR